MSLWKRLLIACAGSLHLPGQIGIENISVTFLEKVLLVLLQLEQPLWWFLFKFP
jgi:hypothetical protein